MTKTAHDPNARELCLALATVCEICGEWEGARVLRRVAERLYGTGWRVRR